MRLHGDDRPISYTMEAGSPTQRVEPITLEMAKLHLRITASDEDSLITAYIAAARSYFEEQTERQCINAVWEYSLDGVPFEGWVEIPRPPMHDDVTLVYDDAAGDEQTYDAAGYGVKSSFSVPAGSPSDFVIDPHCQCGRIELVSGATWPTTSGLARSLRVRRTCGYGATAADMPQLLQVAVLLLVGHFYSNREEVVSAPAGEGMLRLLPMGAQALINGFKWTALTRTVTTDAVVWP